jgi:hypothetical protein
MRFTEFPDDEVAFHQGQRMRFGGPPDSGVGDLETMRRVVDIGGGPMDAFSARIELEEGDLELLRAGHPIYLTQYGGVIPIAVDIPVERVVVPDSAAGLIEADRCPAHGHVACTWCAQNPADCGPGSGEVPTCSFYRATGMHWDTCPNRIRSAPPA